MQINLTFNGYQEMRNFCQQIVGSPDPVKEPDIQVKVKEPEKKQEKAVDEKPKRGRKSTISDDRKSEILKYYNGGYSVKEISSLVGVSSSTVFRIINKK